MSINSTELHRLKDLKHRAESNIRHGALERALSKFKKIITTINEAKIEAKTLTLDLHADFVKVLELNFACNCEVGAYGDNINQLNKDYNICKNEINNLAKRLFNEPRRTEVLDEELKDLEETYYQFKAKMSKLTSAVSSISSAILTSPTNPLLLKDWSTPSDNASKYPVKSDTNRTFKNG